MYVCMYVYTCQDGTAVGFVDFTKLLFAFSSLAQQFNRLRSIQEHVFVILSQCKACTGRFREETAGKGTGSIAGRRLLRPTSFFLTRNTMWCTVHTDRQCCTLNWLQYLLCKVTYI